jgi:Uma2 family endonuclease
VRREDFVRRDYTAEEAFWLNPPGRWELVRGEFVYMMSPTGTLHGYLVQRIAQLLGEFVGPAGLGLVLAGDPGFVLRRHPDTVRAPDVAFIRRSRVPDPLPEQYFEGAPDLAIEVLSPDDRWPEVEAKITEYLDAGTVEVWVIDPRKRQAHAVTPAGRRVLGGGDELASPELLPGFALRLADLFR